MKLRSLLYRHLTLFSLLSCCNLLQKKPNFILFLADDMGYGDLWSYGHKIQEKGPIDLLVEEGVRFTSCYSVHSLCTPSRAAILTGRLPTRFGVKGGPLGVFLPGSSTGLPHSEVTIAEVLKTAGYISAIVGKWHLGINRHNSKDGFYLPHSQGFDFVGHILPLSLVADCGEQTYYRHQPDARRCFLYKNTTLVQQPLSLKNLTQTLVQDAISFIKENSGQQKKPFFLYFSFPQVHNPMIQTSRFHGSSKRGVYGDQIQEMQWAVGEVIKTLQSLSIDDDTMLLFMSDHGPHLELCDEGGSPGIFKGGKGTFYDGGLRVPLIARWKNHIKPGQVYKHYMSSMDVYATLADLAGADTPADRIIDGQSFRHVLDDSSSLSDVGVNVTVSTNQSERPLFFQCNDHLVAVRYKDFKIYYYTSPLMPSLYPKTMCQNGRPSDHSKYFAEHCDGLEKQTQPVVYNVEVDPSEEFPLSADQYEDIIDQVDQLKRKHLQSIDNQDNLLNSDYVTNYLIPCCNPPYCVC